MNLRHHNVNIHLNNIKISRNFLKVTFNNLKGYTSFDLRIHNVSIN